MKTGIINSRAVIAGILAEWLKTSRFPDRLIENETRNRAFVTEVVYGAVKWKRLLLWIAGQCSAGKPQKETAPYLLTGLYQVMMTDTAPHAAVNETVEAAKQNGLKHAAGYINSVLRRALMEKDVLTSRIVSLPQGIRASHPDILVTRWEKTFGPRKTRALCTWNNDRPSLALKPDTLKTSAAGCLARLKQAGFDARKHPYNPDEFIAITHSGPVTALPGFDEGHFTIQDPSTMEAVSLLCVEPGQTVLDACAAPGGKTALIAEKLAGRGKLLAMDIHDDRIEVLRDTVRRMRPANVETVKGDAASAACLEHITPPGGFDRILLDAPCTNTGVLQKRADARWRFSNRRLENLVELQSAMLDNVSRFVRKGGILVYSTCSIEPEEGKLMVDSWLEKNCGFKLRKKVKLFPPESRTDGIFAASITRTE